MKIRSSLMLSGCLIAISASPLYAAAPASKTGGNVADLRLALDKATLDAETGKMEEALKQIEKLKAKYPNNAQVLQTEADINIRRGNRGAGFAALNKALVLEPGNEDIMDKQRTALLEQGSFVSGGYKFRRSKQAYENIESLSGQAALSDSLRSELSIENNHIRTRGAITRANGAVGDFSGNHQRATVTLGKIYNSGDEFAASLYAGNTNIGGGGLYRLWDNNGSTAIQANLRRPDWDYVETVVGNGTKDNIRVERKQSLFGNLKATLGAGYNNYNLDHKNNAASAAAWDLNIGYPYAYDNKTNFGVYYTVDAEYFSHISHRTIGGTTFAPLPVKSYEVHSLNISASRELASQLTAEGFGGYSFDRLGGNGPSFGASLEYAPQKNLGFDLHASRGIAGERNSGRVDQAGLNLKWRL